MNIQQLQQGEASTLLFTAEGLIPSSEFLKGEEVRIVIGKTGRDPFLSNGRSTLAVSEFDDVTRRKVELLREADSVRLCWIAARHETDGRLELAVQVSRFKSKIAWTEKVSFAVDERIHERIQKIAGHEMSIDRACQWLADQVFLRPMMDGDLTRAVATGSPDTTQRFRLLGNRVWVDVSPDTEKLVVERVGPTRRKETGFRPPEFLIEADIEFVDETIAGKLRQSVRSQIEKLVSETDSYIGLWQTYQTIEQENLIRRAKKLGWLEYRTFQVLPNGLWRFNVSDLDALKRFKAELSEAGQEEVEVSTEPPQDLVNDAFPNTESKRSERAAVASVEQIRLDRREVFLRPLDEDSDVVPPPKGVIFGALHGDWKRLERRDQAVQRIKSADARMPQLGLILEGKNPFVRRVDRIDAFTPEARAVFGTGTPTDEQRQAIDFAVNTPDIVVIQGPPGTGKTKVIAAIAARLAKAKDDRKKVIANGKGGSTLLTSYQHEAVDNAAAKSSVLGLPPVRFGGRRGESASSEDQIQRWAIQAQGHIESVLAELPEERPLALYRSVRDRVAAYASGSMSEAELNELLDELIELPPGTFPTTYWEKLHEIRNTPKGHRAGTNDLEVDLARKCVRGLRTTPDAFCDDGPRKARQVLLQLSGQLTEPQVELLTRASVIPPGECFEEIDSLASLQKSLLDGLSFEQIPGEMKQIDAHSLDVLNGVVTELNERMRQGTSGIADILQEYSVGLREDPHGVRRLLELYANVYAATCQQAVGHHVVLAKGGENVDLEFETVIVDEAARANPLDLFIPMSLATRRIILVGDHRQLPHLLDPDVEVAVSNSVKEAEQHALKRSLFQHLFENLPKLRKSDDEIRVITLRDQYRMHPELGKFVSDVFYAPHQEAFRSPRPASEFAHNLDGYQRAGQPVCCAWKDVGKNEGLESPGRSKSRPAEARWIAKEIRRILVDLGAQVSIGVISYYRAQVDELLASLTTEGIAERDPDTDQVLVLPEWRTLEREDGSLEDRLSIGTVDAFQGKEFDVVFLSATRSNELPSGSEDERRRKFGHLMLENRLCVAMSRQRKLLIGVGDRSMFEGIDAREAVPGIAKFIDLCGGDHGLVT